MIFDSNFGDPLKWIESGGDTLNKALNKFYHWLFGSEETRQVASFLKFIEGEGAKKRLGGGNSMLISFFICKFEKKSLPGPLPPPNYIVYHRESETSSVLTNWHSHLHQRKLCTVWNCYWLCRRNKREILTLLHIVWICSFIINVLRHITLIFNK